MSDRLPEPYYEREIPMTIMGSDIIGVTKYESPGDASTSRGMTPERLLLMCSHSTPTNNLITEGFCRCGCGAAVSSGRSWVSGHNLNVLPRTEAHNRRIGESQARAWRTKRKRMPIGSTYVNHDGYVVVKMVEGAGRWKLQHVIVAEGVLGRPLKGGEIVHHINGVRDDNRPENLHVFAGKSDHNASHKSYSDLMESLINDGIVTFNTSTGRYER